MSKKTYTYDRMAEENRCPYCGAEWPADLELRFCGECGSKLGALSPQVADKERRTLTVLFADLSGFTAFADGRDPEDVEETVGALLGDLGDVVDDYGGYVDKYLGDAIMAVFGAPVAHEDDPSRAVRAALEMRDVLRAFNESRGEALSLSVGINTGDVLWSKLGGGDYTVTGDAVNVAKRLEAAAGEDAVLVSDAVRRRTGDRIRYSEGEAVAIEGRDNSVRTYRAGGIDAGGDGAGTAGRVDAPLVGRDDVLDGLLDRHGAPGPAFFAVTGPAGIGKSRLLDAFRERVESRSGTTVHVGHCGQHADLPLEPFGDVLLSRADAGRGDADAGRRVAETVQADLAAIDDPTRRENVAHLLAVSAGLAVPSARVTDLPPDRLRAESSRAWLTWLRELARDGPVVLQFEDLQWADEATLELLGTLRDGLADAADAVTLACSLRPEGTVPDGFEPVELSPLTEADAAAMAEAVLDGTVDGSVSAYLADQAGGNPYFLTELLRYLMDNDLLVETASGYALEGVDRADERVPETLEGLLVGRIDALQPGPKEALKGASVVGRRFWVDVLASVLERETDEAVEALTARGMARPRGESTLPGDTEYALEHALLRDAAYDLLPTATRTSLHGTVAATLADVVGEDAPSLAGRVASHFERAGEHRAAIEWYRRAGDHAGETYAQADAVEYYERGLSLAREHADDATVAALLGDLARVYETIGSVERAREVVREGLSVAPEDSRTACRLLGIQATVQNEHSEFERAARTAERQRDLAATLDAADREAEALHERGVIAKNRGAFDEAREYFTEGQSIAASLDDPGIETTIRKELGVVADLQGEYDRARDCLSGALERAREAGDRRVEGRCLNSLGVVEARQGNYGSAREYWGESLEIDREIGDRRNEATTLNNLGLAAREQGQYDRARDRWEASLARYRDIGDSKGEADVLNNLGLIARDRNAFGLAREYWTESLDRYREVGDRKGVAESLINLGPVVARQGEYDEGEALLSEGLDIARDIGDRLREAWSRHGLGEIERWRGDHERAREHYEASLGIARDLGSPKEERQALDGLGRLALASGDHERARERLDAAATVGEDEEAEPMPLARVRLARAQLALERGERATARERLGRVDDTVTELGATYWQGRCRQLRGEIAAADDDHALARKQFRAALERFETAGAPDDVLATLELLVDRCRADGDTAAAQELLDRAREALADAPDAVADEHREWVRDAAATLDDGP